MKHQASPDDDRFRSAFEALEVRPESFDHAAHVRLAYVYLCECTVDNAVVRMKRALLAFLAHLGVGEAKFHETVTRSWVMAVDHFMRQSPALSSSTELLQLSPQLLDTRIMLTHYSAAVLFSPAARQAYVEPDIQAIPPP